MSNQSNLPAPDPITWDFTVNEQGFMSRYGRLGEEFYKQFLPLGLPDPSKHPPKRIIPRLYALALYHHKLSQSQLSSS